MPGGEQDESINIGEANDQDEDTFRLHFNNATERRKSLFQPPVRPMSDIFSPARQIPESPLFFPEGPVDNDEPASPLQSSIGSGSDVEDGSPHASPNKETVVTTAPKRRKKQKISKHGLKVPALPSSLIKRLGLDALEAMGRRKSRIGRDSLNALEQATEWFFEQIGEDLEAYSQHAGRKRRIDESDVLTLMKRYAD